MVVEAALESYGAADAAWPDLPTAKKDVVVAVVQPVHSSPSVEDTTSVVTALVEAEAMEAAALGPSSS